MQPMKIPRIPQQCFAYAKHCDMVFPMRFALRLLAICFLVPLFTQCGETTAPVTNVVTGPFDDRGNYIEDWVDHPDRWYRPSTPSGGKKKPATTVAKKETMPPPEIAVVSQVQTRPELVTATPKPKPKATPKPKPKPKPVTVRHTVKKGDTLSALARKYGTSISKIQSANNIKGSVIRLGQTLTIPK